MSTEAATVLVYAVLAYAGLGVVFAVPFVLVGVARVDPMAAHGTAGFRVLIFPGVAALWPLLLTRWLSGRGVPVERSSHRSEQSPHRSAAARAEERP